MKAGEIGPLMAALVAFLESGGGSCVEISAAIGHKPRNVQRAIERLRARRSPLVANVQDGRKRNGGRQRLPRPVEDPPTARNVLSAALQSRSLLERAWGGGLAELG